MTSSLAFFLNGFIKVGAFALVMNEVRGLILAGPVIYAIYQSGGTLTAIWLGVSSLGGIALSVIVPVVAAGKLKKLVNTRLARKPGLA
ncbi:hypothetical protein N0B51_10425 [Tsuneonella sp. YG55]|uniref:Uncharacterized protein n=1 Tax=Tsuneonella litorea TaxID=2976475 RepID=A0A9X2W2J4_9SPHN|nr:hypothetical protein [Tsuneonella litorea]MCT2559393.1 hypothetical protein [Tsuneonella litorea]